MVFLTSRGARPILAFVAAALALVEAPAFAQATLENDVKATFLYNFTKFIEWPPSAGSEGNPLRLCVLADPEFTRAVDRTIAGESVDGRPLERIEPASVDDVRRCAILYVGPTHLTRAARFLVAARQLPVLTVGEGSRFIDQGGAIAFVLEHNRVRFDISNTAVQRSGLKASSKLLRVARSVEGAPR
jgi:hypothetical protein